MQEPITGIKWIMHFCFFIKSGIRESFKMQKSMSGKK